MNREQTLHYVLQFPAVREAWATYLRDLGRAPLPGDVDRFLAWVAEEEGEDDESRAFGARDDDDDDWCDDY